MNISDSKKQRERELSQKNIHGLKEKINPAQISVLSHINAENIFSLESRKKPKHNKVT